MKIIVIRYSELTLKGKNRKNFIEILCKTVDKRLSEKNLVYNIKKKYDSIIIEPSESILDDYLNTLKFIIGISFFSVVEEMEFSIEKIKNIINNKLPKNKFSFRITINNFSKVFYKSSKEFIDDVASNILNSNPNASVDLTKYDFEINIDINSEKKNMNLFWKNSRN